jgi:hypothetical protein
MAKRLFYFLLRLIGEDKNSAAMLTLYNAFVRDVARIYAIFFSAESTNQSPLKSSKFFHDSPFLLFDFFGFKPGLDVGLSKQNLSFEFDEWDFTSPHDFIKSPLADPKKFR